MWKRGEEESGAGDVEDGVALGYAVADLDRAQLRALLEGGANPDARDRRGMTALMLAAWRGDVAAALGCARDLLEFGADPNAVGAPQGRTALHLAASRDGAKMASLLLEAGADLSARGNRGDTAEDNARESGSESALARLSAEREKRGIASAARIAKAGAGKRRL